MNINSTKSEWNKIAEEWDKEAGDTGVWHQRHDIDPVIVRLAGKVKEKKILEIGCGNGYLSRKMAKKGAKVTAIDISEKFIHLASNKEKRNPLGVRYFVKDAANLRGIKSRNFDIVIANMVLIDIPNAEKTIKETSRILKEKGKFIFSITHPVLNDFIQERVIINKDRKYLAVAVYKYLTPFSIRETFGVGKITITATQFHRPIGSYFKYLTESNFLVKNLIEVATKRKPTKVNFLPPRKRPYLLKYKNENEKKIKEFALKEIPWFLVISAIKN